MSQPLKCGSTYKFRLNATKDSVTWPLTSATVVLQLTTPAGVTSNKAATGDATGAYFVCATTDLSTAGTWRRTWLITDGAVVQESNPIPFGVINPP